MDYPDLLPSTTLHWNYRRFTEFPMDRLRHEEKKITDIYLKENLISTVPSEIGRLANLASLYLSGNDIRVLPEEISNLRCLKCLDVSGNKIRLIPDAVGEMRNLRVLILDENEIMVLPLRLRELKLLRYLSVCDNNLQWLPQRPVHNYHHCEFRFWRNRDLRCMPYSLWYHMFKDQQIRSLNIGCLEILENSSVISTFQGWRLKIFKNDEENIINIKCIEYDKMLDNKHKIPSLFELCKRKIYQMIHNKLNKSTNDFNRIPFYSDATINNYKESDINNNVKTDIIDEFDNIELNCTDKFNFNNTFKNIDNNKFNKNIVRLKKYYNISDIFSKDLNFLPKSIKNEIANGPVTLCENSNCKMPIFNYPIVEFCLENITLIDCRQEIVLSAAFCCRKCSELWKENRTNTIKSNFI